LLKAGLACHYTFYSSDPVLARAQTDARLGGGRGFWASNALKPRCTQAGEAPVITPRAAPKSAGDAFHGNISSHVYHSASCKNYNCRNCTRVFASHAKAQGAGYRPAADCLRR
jgi:hypothetical protein